MIVLLLLLIFASLLWPEEVKECAWYLLVLITIPLWVPVWMLTQCVERVGWLMTIVGTGLIGAAGIAMSLAGW